jgi:hypothetical protein
MDVGGFPVMSIILRRDGLSLLILVVHLITDLVLDTLRIPIIPHKTVVGTLVFNLELGTIMEFLIFNQVLVILNNFLLVGGIRIIGNVKTS